MGSINFFKPLSTFLQPAPLINLSNIEGNFQECQKSNPQPLGEKQQCYLSSLKPPSLSFCDLSIPKFILNCYSPRLPSTPALKTNVPEHFWGKLLSHVGRTILMDQVTFFLRGLGRFVGSVDSLAQTQNFQANNRLLKLSPGLAKQIFGSTVGGWHNWTNIFCRTITI